MFYKFKYEYSPCDLEDPEETEGAQHWDTKWLILVVTPDLLPNATQDNLHTQHSTQSI